MRKERFSSRKQLYIRLPSFIMQKAQGALEYLLLIGGAMLVAVIVISILVGLEGGSGYEAELATAHAQ